MLPSLALMLLAVLLWASGQLLMKQGTSNLILDLSPDKLVSTFWSIATNLFIMGGLILNFSGTFCYLAVLSRMPISWAYPLEGLTIVLVSLAGLVIFHEQIPLDRSLVIIMIASGIILVARSN